MTAAFTSWASIATKYFLRLAFFLLISAKSSLLLAPLFARPMLRYLLRLMRLILLLLLESVEISVMGKMRPGERERCIYCKVILFSEMTYISQFLL